jgi:hypothetical protein
VYDLPPPPSSPPASNDSKLDRRHTGRLRKRDNLLTGEVGRGGAGAKSYDGNQSVLGGTHLPVFLQPKIQSVTVLLSYRYVFVKASVADPDPHGSASN